MDNRAQDLAEALDLTRRALAILDNVRADLPAIHLQQAIDELTDAPIPRTPDEAEAMMATPEMQMLLRRLFGDDTLH